MDELLGRQSAIAEARALYRMVGSDGNTVQHGLSECSGPTLGRFPRIRAGSSAV